jgi:hypothetical protein
MQSLTFFRNFTWNKLEIDKLLTVHRGQFMHNFIQSLPQSRTTPPILQTVPLTTNLQ